MSNSTNHRSALEFMPTHTYFTPFLNSARFVILLLCLYGLPALAQQYNPNGITVAGGNGNGINPNQLGGPRGAIHVDQAGNTYLYVVNQYNHFVTKHGPDLTTFSNGTIVAGSPGSGSTLRKLTSPTGVFVDAAGNIYVADTGNRRIMKFGPTSTSATNGSIVAGGNGSGNGANQFDQPNGVHVDGSGNIYVADFQNRRIQKFGPTSTPLTSGTTVAGGNGYGTNANQMGGPAGVFMDTGGNLYVADQSLHRVQKFPPSSTQASPGTVVAGATGSGGAGVSGSAANLLFAPRSVFVDATGNLFVADHLNHRIQNFGPNSTSLTNATTVAGTGTAGSTATTLDQPSGVYLDALGNIYVADLNNHRVQKFTPVLSLMTGVSSTLVCPNATVALSVTAAGGNKPYTYAWTAPSGGVLNPGGISTSAVSATLTVAGLQTFTVTITDTNNPSLTATGTVSVSVNSAITASITGDLSICLSQTGVLTASGAGAGGTYSWNTMATSNTISASPNQTYSVTATAATGCTATASVNTTQITSVQPTITVIVPNSSTVTVSGQTPTITLPAGIVANMLVTGGSAYELVITIDRINGYEIRQVQSSATGLFMITQPGPYRLTVQGAYGCSRTVEGVIVLGQ